MPSKNLGLVGGSNERIFRLAVSETLETRYDLVICAWSAPSRYELFYKGRPMTMPVGSEEYYGDEFRWAKDFVANHYDFHFEEERGLLKMIALQSYFSQRNQPYLFTTACGPATVSPKNSWIAQHIDWNNWISPGVPMYLWCNHLPTGPGGHFLEEGHRLVADRIYEFILQRKLLE